ncbi:SatD family protein [Agreia sp. PsM10]|uniref:SatD family protein n=1 Tax=Agreia sp. PsM10 TaxID=3030533 RepID=UPI00263BE786|nr:SatD family protein [Agreia sp. PsM10]MDN4641015.1 SatD family protein [Agreia sp. PsM10]
MIIDVSRSREHPDRRALQRELQRVFAEINDIEPGEQLIEPTVGDEFQAVYSDLGRALRATMLTQLFLPVGIECRFGLGSGEMRAVGEGVVGAVQDGSAWWRAREAVNEARKHEYSKLGFVRTWFRATDAETRDSGILGEESLVNAYLLSRDHIIGSMSARACRLFRGHLLGGTQARLAEDEGITQSAVSQSLAKSGANALAASESLLLARVL